MNSRDKNIFFLRGLHVLLALALPFLLTLLMGCKKAKEEKEDLGPEVGPESIDQALGKAIQGAKLEPLRVGQYLDYGVVRRLENEESVITLGATRAEVIAQKESEHGVTYTIKIARSSREADGSFSTR
ncbi:MAG: hypothetical protein HC902_13105, partial [Calothrix sp. SM1_5_4]|nr:hypothetical protein [Calothrix sp. SM1_5_4]